MASKPKPGAGWGFGGKQDVQLNVGNQVQQKVNIWEQTNEDLILIPDMDQEQKEQEVQKVSQTGTATYNTVQDIKQLDNITQMTTLPQTEEDVDLSYLIGVLRPVEEIRENDEQWEFIKLKTDIYELVSNLYRTHNFQEEDDEDNENEGDSKATGNTKQKQNQAARRR